MWFELYPSGGQWRWRLKASNGQIIASGESYWNKTDAENAIRLVKSTDHTTPTRETSG